MKKKDQDVAQGENIVEALDVHKHFEMQKVTVRALQGVTLRIQRGEIVAIMGPSGCGKTTLLNCLSGLDSVTQGTVKLGQQDLQSLSDRQLTRLRAREMGFVFQAFNLLPVLTGLENVELPLLVSGMHARQARARALASLDQVGLSEWAHHRPGELSGGQRQRFALARALTASPALVWADEPTGALDSTTGQEVIDVMLRLNRDLGLTFVWVTHAPEVARQATRLVTMSDGRISSDKVLSPATAEGGRG
jgi:ABC-type lipoprotein export system ATPase subunit